MRNGNNPLPYSMCPDLHLMNFLHFIEKDVLMVEGFQKVSQFEVKQIFVPSASGPL